MSEPNPEPRFTRLENGQKLRTTSLAEVLKVAPGELGSERWVFVSPHDDDTILGAGLWLIAALEAGVDAHILIATDGRGGYCTPEQEHTIAEVRAAEIDACYRAIGMTGEQIHQLGFPDSHLLPYQGRYPARFGDPAVAGYTGLQNAFTYHLRQIRPARVIVPTLTDLHPDHKLVNQEFLISLFHAEGVIWPELGPPTPVPKVYEMAVYCDFTEPANLEYRSDDATFQKKMKGIEAFVSQAQIAATIERVRVGGPYEYLREVDFKFYSPETYKPLFA